MKRIDTYKDKNGNLNHDNDCYIYKINGVCTCGLIHLLSTNNEYFKYDINQKITNDWEKHNSIIYYLNHNDDIYNGNINDT